MYALKPKNVAKSGFTIVELIVVISIVGILATISVVGYGAWRTSVTATQIKSDLNATASAMENARTFNNGYPTTLPTTVTPSEGVTLTLQTGSTATAYCVDGVSSDNPALAYYVASETKDQGALEGTCATRPGQTIPSVPTNLATSSVASTSIGLTWVAGSGGGTASSYTAQCASDAAFVSNFGQTTVTATAGTVSGLAAAGTHYCRVKAVNVAGDSPWSTAILVDTDTYQPPTGLALNSSTGTSLTLGWTANSDATSYTLQCALNASFTTGLESASITPPTVTGTFTDLAINTPYYCRINSVTPLGTSVWSGTLTTSTGNYYGSLAVATSIEGYWTTAPTGFLLEDGSAVSRTTYADLFAIIGTTYGAGNGSTTFNLPDSRGRTSVNLGSSDTEFDTIGEKPGSKTEALTIAQIPSHTHTGTTGSGNAAWYRLVYNGGGGRAANHATGWNGGSGVSYPTNTAYSNSIHTHSFTTNATGSNATHNNIQPSIVKRSAIKYAPVDPLATTLPEGTSIEGYWNSAPTGYLFEDGTAVSRTTYSGLFATIGTTYGAGNGSTTFNLPDSRARVAVNRNSSDTEFDTIGEKYGSKTEILTIAQMASHTHTGTTGSGNAAFYRLVYNGGSGTNDNHTRGWDGGGGYADYNDAEYPLAYHTHSFTTNATGSNATHNNIQPSIVKRSAIKSTAISGTSSQVSTGTSVEGYWSSAPSGYLVEDGTAVSRTTYADLFAVIGTTYGAGNGSTTFNLPDSRGRTSVNLSSSDTEFDTMGEKPGSKTEALTIGQLPSHTHTGITGYGNTLNYGLVYATGTGRAGNHMSGWNGSGGYADYNDTNYPMASHTHSFTTGTTGSGAAHNNIQPSIVKLFVIKY